MTGKLRRPFFVFLVSGRKCNDAMATALFGRYIAGTVNAREKEVFGRHLVGCTYCRVLVENSHTIREASRYYRLPPGPELDPYLTWVRIYARSGKIYGLKSHHVDVPRTQEGALLH